MRPPVPKFHSALPVFASSPMNWHSAVAAKTNPPRVAITPAELVCRITRNFHSALPVTVCCDLRMPFTRVQLGTRYTFAHTEEDYSAD